MLPDKTHGYQNDEMECFSNGSTPHIIFPFNTVCFCVCSCYCSDPAENFTPAVYFQQHALLKASTEDGCAFLSTDAVHTSNTPDVGKERR